MASFSAGTTFTDGVANDVTAAKLGALVNNATPTSGLIQDRTAETVTATNDTLLIGDASDSNNLKRITVANFAQTLPTAKVTTGTIDTATLGTTTGTAATFTTGTITTLTAGTTTSTAATITTGTITTGVIPTLTSTTLITSGTGTAAAPAIVPTGDTNTGIFFPAADTIAFSKGGTESMRIDSSGNVGIGTASPATPLNISTSASSVVSETVRLENSSNSASNGNKITWRNAGQTTECAFISGIREGAATSFGVAIGTSPNFTSGGTNAVERLRIDSSGNVGIGTTSPSTKLHVDSGSAAQYGKFNSTAANGGYLTFESSSTVHGDIGTAAQVVSGGSASDFGINARGSRNLVLGTNNTERLRIDSSGNVGIGVTSPAVKLDVSNGNIQGKEILLQNGAASSPALGTTPSWYSPASGVAALSTNAFERLRIDSSGFVSIGTATGLSALHVHGNVTLSNTTTATSAGTGGLSKPATYAGYLTVSINGTSRKIPYYAT